MQDQLNYLESAERRNRRDMERLDSLLTENLASNRELRADVYTALDELRQEMATTRETMNDLGTRIDRRGTDHAVIYQPSGPADTVAGQPPVGQQVDAKPMTVDCARLYEQAFDDLRNGNYSMAIDGFNGFLQTCASSPDMPRALYWLGECYYSSDSYEEAIRVFEQVVSEYGETEWVPGALFKIGRSYEKLDQPRHAIANYERLLKDYPNASIARPAEIRLGVLKEQQGDE